MYKSPTPTVSYKKDLDHMPIKEMSTLLLLY